MALRYGTEQAGPVPWEYNQARLILWTGWTLDYVRGLDLWEARQIYAMLQIAKGQEQ